MRHIFGIANPFGLNTRTFGVASFQRRGRFSGGGSFPNGPFVNSAYSAGADAFSGVVLRELKGALDVDGTESFLRVRQKSFGKGTIGRPGGRRSRASP
jgi:hypothetical protein